MITVRCPVCAKIIGFDEADGGALVACPHCREPFFVPAVARSVVPVEAGPAPVAPPPSAPPLPQAPALPDNIGVAADPDLDPVVEQYDEVLPVEEETPLAEPHLGFEVVAEPDSMPRLELDTPPPAPIEPSGTPAEVKPTDLAPTLAAAETLADALPPPEQPIDVLDEVDDDERIRHRRPKSKKRAKERDDTDWEALVRPGKGATPARIMGGAGVFLGGLILVGTLLQHLIGRDTAWHWGVCCGDVFALALVGVGLFFLIRG